MLTVIRFFNDGAVDPWTFTQYMKLDEASGELSKLQVEILYALYRAVPHERFTQASLSKRLGEIYAWFKTDTRSIREAIADLRLKGAMIASGNKGFWRAETREEMKKTIERQYTKQALNMLWKARVIRDHTIAYFGGQRVLDYEVESILDQLAYINPEDRG